METFGHSFTTAGRYWPFRSQDPEDRSSRLLGLVAAASVLLAGTIAYRLPGFSQLTADTSATPYYLVAGLTLLAAGLLVNMGRPVAGGAQVAVIGTLTGLSTV